MQLEEATTAQPQWLQPHPEHNASTLNMNTTQQSFDERVLAEVRELYIWATPVLLMACGGALFVNAHVLAAVCWIRRPLSRTLRLSISLAAADALSSLCLGLGFLFNSLFHHGLLVRVEPCFALALEALRMGAIVTTELHLVTLACHHLMGILRPLQYPGEGFSRVAAFVAFASLWLAPPAFFAIYFSAVEEQGFQTPECTYDFMRYFKYRVMVGCLVLVPLVAMFLIYGSIFGMVRRHEAQRPRHHSSAGRASHATTIGSRKSATSSVKIVANGPSSSRYHRVARQVKAIRTTLLIVGSCAMGWVPPLTVYVLMCVDCPMGEAPVSRSKFYLYCTVNFLLIFKTLLNPIIYAARMTEIKLAARRMHAKWLLCRDAEDDVQRRFDSSAAPSLGRSLTVVCRLRSRSPQDSVRSGSGFVNGFSPRLRRASTRTRTHQQQHRYGNSQPQQL